MEQSIETFYRSVAQSPATLTQLTSGVQTPDEFIDRAVAMGNEQGYAFSREEASTWINAQIEGRKNGELSDVQLEGVAGGKGLNFNVNNITGNHGGSGNANFSGWDTLGSSMGEAFTKGANDIGNWFASW
jgi:hypothetical protein